MQVLFANRPTCWVQESDFRVVETAIPKPTNGQVLVKSEFLSLVRTR
ncbi:MAG TPA: hypothetical protein VK714_12795 [Myxococcota bacterium]|nr:hypothetical protein [Myxococcota bacterium]